LYNSIFSIIENKYESFKRETSKTSKTCEDEASISNLTIKDELLTESESFIIISKNNEIRTSEASFIEKASANSLIKSNLPLMNQDEFISFWRIIYNLFTGMDNEAEMYHCAATVSTLLLKLGEASRKLQLDSENPKRSLSSFEIKSTDKQNKSDKPPKSAEDVDGSSSFVKSESQFSFESDAVDVDAPIWCISFEQLIKFLLSESMLVDYFSTKYDIKKKLEQYKLQHA
jgi:hypothetical protein